MSVFRIPQVFCLELGSLMARFWWGENGQSKKVYRLSWKKMGSPKCHGGSGFWNLECFNLALLANQLWRIITHPLSLSATILKEKYFKTNTLMEATVKGGASFLWHIAGARDVIKVGGQWRLGNGESIRIWKDKWLPSPLTFQVQSPPSVLHDNTLVKELFLLDVQSWNVDLVLSLFGVDEAHLILATHISRRNSNDKYLWGLTEDGTFFIKSAYQAAIKLKHVKDGEASVTESSPSSWKHIWSLKILEKGKTIYGGFTRTLSLQTTIYSRNKLLNAPIVPSASLRSKQPSTWYGTVNRQVMCGPTTA